MRARQFWITEYTSPITFTGRLQLMAYNDTERKSLVLLGPSGIGKTGWAKQNIPKPALFISHIDDLKRIHPEIKGLIFDDMDFKHWPETAQIHIVDRENTRSINVKHSTVTIPSGIAKIFTCNSFPFKIDTLAIDRRINKIDLY